MKIEDSPFQFNGASPVEKLRRNAAQSSFDLALDELDMSFLELLGSITGSVKPNAAKRDAGSVEQAAETGDAKKEVMAEATNATKLSTEKNSSKTGSEHLNTQVDPDMALIREQLSLLDIQYLKQEVIPGLPILMGSVPFNSIFPQGADGEISYKGFDISPKLAELIEKGYKTGRPIRVELDPNSALVLKIRNGQVSAEFVSADKAAAFVMQQELDELRNRMAARNLPVGTLEYKYQDSRQNRQGQDENAGQEQ